CTKRTKSSSTKLRTSGFMSTTGHVSCCVLREFISKRKQKHEAMLSKRARSSGKVDEKDIFEV
ncbi:unnamed protein product, partial [Brassica rapa subsp. narinosa]